MFFYKFINKKVIVLLLFFCLCNVYAQDKKPWMFRWQDKHATKQIHRYIKHDTIIATSQANLHICYSNDNSKPYLLLLHGMGANGRTNWGSQFKALSKEFNLIVPDLIYFGESTSTSNNYSPEFQVEQIHEAIIKLGINAKLNVMGFSYGGLSSAVYNQLFYKEVNKLIIIDGPVKFFSLETSDSLAKAVGAKNMADVIVPTTIHDFNAMQKAVMSRSFPITKGLKRKIINTLFVSVKDTRLKQIKYLTDNQSKYQSYSYNLDVTKTLLIWGEKDGVVPLTVGKKLHEAYPQTILITYPKAKHDAHFRYAKKLNKEVIKFLLTN